MTFVRWMRYVWRTVNAVPQPRSRLDAVMIERGIQNLDLTLRARISESRISRYRHGLLPPLEARRAIAKALGLPMAELWPPTQTKETEHAA